MQDASPQLAGQGERDSAPAVPPAPAPPAEGAAEAPDALNRTGSFAEATAQEVPPGGLLHLQVSVQLGDYWLQAYGFLTLVLQIGKAAKFDYPPGWSWTELSVLVLYFAVLQLHRVAGCFANRAQNALSTGCFLALTAVLVLVTGYFGALQVYVLQVEFATGIVSLSILGCQLVLGIFAGQRYSKRLLDVVLLCSCAALAVIALVSASILDATAHTLGAGQMQFSLAAGLTLALFGLLMALVAGCCLVRDV
ncbi:unnamed protein product [Symbiodinium sp. CCMP2456]|nr:unnamed protein product [Symbiodinium sp. CCMP2456]